MVSLFNNIVIVTSMGISTNISIPDFRSRGGIYANRPSNVRNLFYVTTLSHLPGGPALVAFCNKRTKAFRAQYIG
ncbi:hypothetical protein BKA67DRAFT_557352 [Truncatella angustata]|uniref:Uncharacterized protein n=1 Tax=Truncatella angustata TaxID=152316 RepID=A0A9P8UU05_9PEZI|nr:uncharacterized protein BKA67DRAFT_557352 [Truncatella angustata]KAH6658179.1 hypothetical protein BKA67DRAFT_557352 [Truncatella angustata]